ncbi:glutathione transferase GstA [Agrobacterium pusense]|jgi:glutathione S-transferase|uniref:glutathione transferase GstA n=1 Tax=Agrobacterium pusense TaxID=648995 RepID=UPI002452D4F5|nr:glutathione transferase GstA [Agrobacterium pusense]
MKLYFASATCSFAPHIVLQELGLPYNLVRVDNQTKLMSEPGNFLAINPKGYVAALALGAGDVLTEGPAILQYLADLNPDLGLAPVNGTLERARLQEWLNFVTSEIHAGSSPLFNRGLPETVRDAFRKKLTRRFDFIEAGLAAQEYLTGSRFTVADAYLFTVLGWMKGFDIDLGHWPKVGAYMRRIEGRPSVAAALKREAAVPFVG